jgi:hypothetical protein
MMNFAISPMTSPTMMVVMMAMGSSAQVSVVVLDADREPPRRA